MMKKALAACAVTLAASAVFAGGLSSLNISQATRQKMDDLLHSNPSQWNLDGSTKQTVDTAKVSGKASGADASMTKDAVKKEVQKVDNYVTQNTAEPSYQKLLKPTGHAAVRVAKFIVKDLPKDAAKAVRGVVDTIEFSAVKGVNGVTGMANATGQDASAAGNAVSNANSAKVSQTNLNDTAEAASNAATVNESTNDSAASKAFSSNPAKAVRDFKRKQALERQQLIHNIAAQVSETIYIEGVTSPRALAQLAALGDMESQQTGIALTSDDARVRAGFAEVYAVMVAGNG